MYTSDELTCGATAVSADMWGKNKKSSQGGYIIFWTAPLQKQTSSTTYFLSKQLLLFAFAPLCNPALDDTVGRLAPIQGRPMLLACSNAGVGACLRKVTAPDQTRPTIPIAWFYYRGPS